jgi:hypothetical protein
MSVHWSKADFAVLRSSICPRPNAKWIDDNLPPLDPDVADAAPSDSVLTLYDEEHVITYLRLLDADAQGATGANSHEWCCILIRNRNRIAPQGV